MAFFNQTEIPSLNYSHVFKFEEEFVYRDSLNWMEKHWRYSFIYVFVYVTLIYAGRTYMSSRPKFQLRGLLFLWNLSLAVLSICATVRTFPELWHLLREYGFHSTVCNPDSFSLSKVSAFWSFLYALSKVVELGDTAFVVLRKQPLIFLHYYHHSTVLIYTWYSFSTSAATGRWFGWINLLIHSVMYSYYTLRSVNIRVPRAVSMAITTLQLSQMVFGCFINLYVLRFKMADSPCLVSHQNLQVALLMYASYAALFSWYFYISYIQPKILRSMGFISQKPRPKRVKDD